MSKPTLNTKEVAKLIKKHKGFLSYVAKELGCSYRTIHRYTVKYACCKDAYAEAKESRKDFGEAMLIKNMKAGKDASIIFFLKTQAKDRGYVQDDKRHDTEALKEAVDRINAVHNALKLDDGEK